MAPRWAGFCTIGSQSRCNNCVLFCVYFYFLMFSATSVADLGPPPPCDDVAAGIPMVRGAARPYFWGAVGPSSLTSRAQGEHQPDGRAIEPTTLRTRRKTLPITTPSGRHRKAQEAMTDQGATIKYVRAARRPTPRSIKSDQMLPKVIKCDQK